MAKSAPTSAALASFCWRYDVGPVQRLLKKAEDKLASLDVDVGDTLPFPSTDKDLKNFAESSWMDWIESIRPVDGNDIAELRMIVATARSRLGIPPKAETPGLRPGSATAVGKAVALVVGGAAVGGNSPSSINDHIEREQNTPTTKLGERLRELRRHRGWEESVVANRVEIPLPRLWQIERQEEDPTDQELERFAEVFGITSQELKRTSQSELPNSPSTTSTSDEIVFNEDTRASKNTQVGCGSHASRNATLNEKCLNVDEQAEAVSQFTRSASGEFCIAIFGRWGRGKTFLIEQVARSLEGDEYLVTWFNAWKYRSTPELWAHLYESIVRTITKDRSIGRLALAIRAQIVRAGIWPLFTFALLSSLWIVPLVALLHALYTLLCLVGVGLLIFLLAIFRSGSITVAGFRRQFANLASHRTTMGLQATIGDDLRCAIVAAVSRGYFSEKNMMEIIVLWILVALSLSTAYLWIPLMQLPQPDLLFDVMPKPDQWRVLVAVSFWWTLALTLVGGTVFGLPRRKRLLLVVDDLDRCSSQQMLELIESIKLLLEDDDLKDRIRVVMLVEENLLRHAISDKFTAAANASLAEHTDSKVRLRVMVDEHLDKLFLAYYRLPPLTSAQLVDVAERNIKEQLRQVRGELALPMDPLKSDLAADMLDAGQGHNGAVSNTQGSSDEKSPASTFTIETLDGLIYSTAEMDALGVGIRDLHDLLAGTDYSCGPRTVRLFLYRYQLVRLLLQASATPVVWHPKDIVDAMLLAHPAQSYDTNRSSQIDQRVWEAVRSVV